MPWDAEVEGADLLGWAPGAALPEAHTDRTARDVCETPDPPRVTTHVLCDTEPKPGLSTTQTLTKKDMAHPWEV